jgi:hypothetical protein
MLMGCQLVTADRELFNASQGGSYPSHVCWVVELSRRDRASLGRFSRLARADGQIMRTCISLDMTPTPDSRFPVSCLQLSFLISHISIRLMIGNHVQEL